MSDTIERRAFIKGTAAGVVAVTVGGVETIFDAREAKAQGAPFAVLGADEARTLEALGETLVPGARAAGVAHFVDRQLSVAPEDALLEARILNVKPPFDGFYRAVTAALDKAAQAAYRMPFAAVTDSERHDLVDQLRQGKIADWQGPPQPFVYAVTRADAVDVVYGTMEGYRALGIPYMAHIAPKEKW